MTLSLFGAGVGYVPEFVFHSKAFWLLLAVVIAGIFLYHNIFLSKMAKNSFLGKRFGFFGKNESYKAPKVSYTSDGRSGYVWYRSREADFSMYYEFSGSDCIASISIPGPEDWEKHTGLPLSQREEVLDFIGQQVVNDQTTDGKGSFKVEGGWLNVYGGGNNEK